MNSTSSSLPLLFKGIALFTPGGDLIYCIDPNKQDRWHVHLCAVVQRMLGLPEPPYFLVPAYTATIDRWFDSRTQQIHTIAEAYPPVLRHQALLNAIFGTPELIWRYAPLADGVYDPLVLATHHRQFPQLWEDHDLVVRFEQAELLIQSNREPTWDSQAAIAPLSPPAPASPTPTSSQGYVLRLFVSGINAATEQTLKNLHQLLEQSLRYPYTLKVIDITKHPEQAEIDQVAATPTLVKVWPHPVRRIVGELDNLNKVLQVLGTLE